MSHNWYALDGQAQQNCWPNAGESCVQTKNTTVSEWMVIPLRNFYIAYKCSKCGCQTFASWESCMLPLWSLSPRQKNWKIKWMWYIMVWPTICRFLIFIMCFLFDKGWKRCSHFLMKVLVQLLTVHRLSKRSHNVQFEWWMLEVDTRCEREVRPRLD